MAGLGLGATMRNGVMVAVVGLSLAGCGLATSYQIANMAPGELTKISDNDLCRSGTEKNPAVLAERQKRELGDCNPDHIYCHSLGLKPGTDLYVQCRLQARQIAAQQAAQQEAAQQAGYAAMAKQGAAMMSRSKLPGAIILWARSGEPPATEDAPASTGPLTSSEHVSPQRSPRRGLCAVGVAAWS